MRKHFSWINALCMVGVIGMTCGCQREAKNELMEKDAIPVTISEYSRIQTRVSGSSFETEDQIGLYMLEQPNTLSDIRYADNECFQYSNGEWMGKEQLYYPSASGLYDFIAYYPYNDMGIEEGRSGFTFEVFTNQHSKNNFMYSDLLIADTRNVAPSFDPVSLIFKHKLVEINVELLPGDAYESASELLAAIPEVVIKNVATRTEYDFDTENFTDPSLKEDIVPFGEFVVKDNKLVGVRAIVVPQIIAGNHLLLEIKCGGNIYSFAFGTDHVMAPATKETYSLTMQENTFEGSITAEIEDWENDFSVTGDLDVKNAEEDNDQEKKGYVFTVPDFTASLVYKVMNDGVQIAEICREYLRGDNISSQAIVAYTVKNNQVDLSAGMVAQLLEQDAGAAVSASIYGGIVNWDIENNLFSYQQGDQEAINRIYIDKTEIITSVPIQNAASLSCVPDFISDTRDNRQYPIVKVGTQYWMGENLAAKSFINGEILTDASEATLWKSIQNVSPIKTAAYSIETLSGSLFYDYAAISSGKLAPEGWKLPSETDWTQFRNYVKDPLVLLSHNWENGTNLSGMNIEGWGYRSYAGLDINITIAQKAYFWGDNEYRYQIAEALNSTRQSSKTDGNSVRCIRQ